MDDYYGFPSLLAMQTKQNKEKKVFAYNINNFPTEKKKKSYFFLQVP